MAFEQTPPPPQQLPPSPRRRFDSAAVYGLAIGVIILALVIFIFRGAIAAKIAEWRGTSSPVAVLPNVPTVSPAATTPTPTATAVATPKPTVTPKASASTTPHTTAPAVVGVGNSGGNFPTTGPEDSLALAALGSGMLGIAGISVRYRILRRRLKNRLSQLDIL